MKIKLECYCGMNYEFDVDPVDGRMPYAISCPNCGGDGTDYANQYLAQTLCAPPPEEDVVEDIIVEPANPSPPASTPLPPPTPAQPAATEETRPKLTLPSNRSEEASAPASAPQPASTPAEQPRSKLTLPSQKKQDAETTPPGTPAAAPSSPAPEGDSSGKSPLKIGFKQHEDPVPESAPSAGDKPETENLAAANEEARAKRMAAIKKKQDAEKELWRKMSILGGIGALIALAMVAVLGWYVFVGSKPKEFYVATAKGNRFNSQARLIAPNSLLLLDGDGLVLHDLRQARSSGRQPSNHPHPERHFRNSKSSAITPGSFSAIPSPVSISRPATRTPRPNSRESFHGSPPRRKTF